MKALLLSSRNAQRGVALLLVMWALTLLAP